ncbi:hypothetical protein NIES37_39040 [Tolypothrix tenuis PCC 7101]|uniref:Uncharacterized protein n=1 Tax=Tolypothrix tenuis PCC 7101 TaxID=231146 RepID=A0A1Z4N2R4_9CYAN|nr:hypothetical protein [Aulosira sp. FACHB-113]BAY99921.1 hypothetical protein NIES37_39040 [Tolypothrix tenuis PCC 7101]BAZ76157.1 hypothetical protein NIES50_47550 [Aulosira laxa NIES-50]
MKSSQKFGLIISGITSVIMSTAVVTSSNILKAQAAPKQRAENLVVNGTFGADPLQNPYDRTRNNPFISGWFNSIAQDISATTFLENYTVDDAENYSLSVRLAPRYDDNGPTFTYISQKLKTVPGQRYELIYYLANTDDGPNDNVFQTYVGGQLIDEKVNVPFQGFTKYTYYFVAKSRTTELKFASKQRSYWYNLDNVSVVPVNKLSKTEIFQPEANPSSIREAKLEFTTFDISNAIATDALGINDQGDIIGSFRDSQGDHGFLKQRRSISTFDYPNALLTYANGINNLGNIVGSYYQNTVYHAFLKEGNSFSNVDVPGVDPALAQYFSNQSARDINNQGDFVGFFRDNSGTHGFLKKGNSYSSFDHPNTTYQYTIANGINDWGDIVGFFQDSKGYQAFLKQGNNFTNFTIPNAIFTHPSGINNQGDIVGFFYDGIANRGFLKQGNKFTTINVPGAYSTYVYGINSQGDIVGFFVDGTQRHGFIARKK